MVTMPIPMKEKGSNDVYNFRLSLKWNWKTEIMKYYFVYGHRILGVLRRQFNFNTVKSFLSNEKWSKTKNIYRSNWLFCICPFQLRSMPRDWMQMKLRGLTIVKTCSTFDSKGKNLEVLFCGSSKAVLMKPLPH